MAEIEVREIHDMKRWDEFVLASPQYSLFSTSRWADIISSTTNFTPKFLGCFKGESMVAGMLVHVMKRGPFRFCHFAPLTPYITPLYAQTNTLKSSKMESYEKSVIYAIVENLRKNYKHFVMSLHPSIRDFRPFKAAHLHSMLAYTYILELGNHGELWGNLDKDTKYEIKKAKEKGTKVHKSTDVDEFMRIYQVMCKKQNIPVIATVKMIRKILENLESEILIATNADGINVACALSVYDRDIGYYLLAASDENYKDDKAPSLLLWSAIESVAKVRTKIDLVGANTPMVARFKAGFNPKLVEYIQIEHSTSKVFKMVHGMYKLIRK